MKKTTIKKPEQLPVCLRRRLVFGDEEQINCLQRVSVRIPEDVQISESFKRREGRKNG